MATANAAGLVIAGLYVVCRVLVGLFPDWMFNVGQSWFHGIELTKLGSWNLTAENFILGIVTASVSAWLVGWCFAHCYNIFLKKK